MNHRTITRPSELAQFCETLAREPSIAIDTEFVAEHTYRPVLCLVQVATRDQLVLIDTMALPDVADFWRVVVEGSHETIIHAARSELEFCFDATGALPKRLFDVQVAAGLVGAEYPAGYNSLIGKLLGEKPGKHETRTDWRRRPLTSRQIEYALGDVQFLHPMRDIIFEALTRQTRITWFEEEMQSELAELSAAQSESRWRRVSGNTGMNPRQLGILRALWHWRNAEADRRDKPVRYVLRDDLLIEMARRASADPTQILSVRGMDRGDLRRRVDELSAAVQQALDLPDEELPQPLRRERTQDYSVLGQFLFAALGSLCREAELAPSLVGTPNDIRDLISYDTQNLKADARVPRLARGWRAEFVGRLFDDLIAGKTAVRIGDPRSESPLRFERQ
ncbi:MAG: HRDC domain-containing protein [Patescibacteria group bacterium]|nr:HRDC domain-containing protein [Patescibacteria group bacterium]